MERPESLHGAEQTASRDTIHVIFQVVAENVGEALSYTPYQADYSS
jgi:hypothetical protein